MVLVTRPKPKLPESALLVMGALFAFLSLTIPFVYWPLTSIPTCSAEVIILLFDLLVARCTIVHRLAFLHWRREYELSIDRLIRIADKGHEGGSSIAW